MLHWYQCFRATASWVVGRKVVGRLDPRESVYTFKSRQSADQDNYRSASYSSNIELGSRQTNAAIIKPKCNPAKKAIITVVPKSRLLYSEESQRRLPGRCG